MYVVIATILVNKDVYIVYRIIIDPTFERPVECSGQRTCQALFAVQLTHASPRTSISSTSLLQKVKPPMHSAFSITQMPAYYSRSFSVQGRIWFAFRNSFSRSKSNKTAARSLMLLNVAE